MVGSCKSCFSFSCKLIGFFKQSIGCFLVNLASLLTGKKMQLKTRNGAICEDIVPMRAVQITRITSDFKTDVVWRNNNIKKYMLFSLWSLKDKNREYSWLGNLVNVEPYSLPVLGKYSHIKRSCKSLIKILC